MNICDLAADVWFTDSPVFVVVNVLLIASPPALTLAQVMLSRQSLMITLTGYVDNASSLE